MTNLVRMLNRMLEQIRRAGGCDSIFFDGLGQGSPKNIVPVDRTPDPPARRARVSARAKTVDFRAFDPLRTL